MRVQRNLGLPFGSVAAAGLVAGLVLAPPWAAADLWVVNRLGEVFGVTGAGADWAPVTAAGLAALVALAAQRLRTGAALLVAFTVVVVAAGAAVFAGAPAIEVALAAPIGWIFGRLDAARELRRNWARMLAPVLRASAGPRAGNATDAVGPALAELLDARALLLLHAPPGARKVRAGTGFRMSGTSLRAGAPLDARRAPFRDGQGIARAGDATALVDEPGAMILPLAAAGSVEGYLVVVPTAGEPTLSAAPHVVAAATRAVAGLLRAERLREGIGSFEHLDPLRASAAVMADTAAGFDHQVASIEAAAGRAHTGLCLVSPTGLTLWKNRRFDELAGPVGRGATTGDLARVLQLLRHTGESPTVALERLLAAPGSARTGAAEYGLVATMTPMGELLLLELEGTDAATADALASARAFASAIPGVTTLAPLAASQSGRATTLPPPPPAASVSTSIVGA